MKSKLIFFRVLVLILSVILFFLAILLSEKEVEKVKEEKENEVINFESGNIINLYLSKKDEIIALDLNYYLLCVIGSEMPFKYEIEALKAQAVVARTYLYNKMNKHAEEKGDICDSSNHCQAYTELEDLKNAWRKKGYSENEIEYGIQKIKRAILETDGLVVTYNGELINALFHASSPLKTEDISAIWGNVEVPYLKSVENNEDETYENRNSTMEISYVNFKNTLIENGYLTDLSKDEFRTIKVNEYTNSGRVKNVSFSNYCIKAEDLRKLFGIKSTNFTIELTEDSVIFNVLGFGHGVGLSQVGADWYAKQGYGFEDIIYHYYTGVEVINIQKK